MMETLMENIDTTIAAAWAVIATATAIGTTWLAWAAGAFKKRDDGEGE